MRKRPKQKKNFEIKLWNIRFWNQQFFRRKFLLWRKVILAENAHRSRVIRLNLSSAAIFGKNTRSAKSNIQILKHSEINKKRDSSCGVRTREEDFARLMNFFRFSRTRKSGNLNLAAFQNTDRFGGHFSTGHMVQFYRTLEPSPSRARSLISK